MSIQPSVTPVRNVRPLRGWGFAAIALVAAVVVTELISALVSWATLADFERTWQNPGPDPQDRQEWTGDVWAGGLAMFLQLAAGVVIIVWMWLARRNAQALCAGKHRLPIGWVIGAWFCPVVNFWFPQMILSDIMRASDPETPADATELRDRSGGGLVTGWWLAFLASWALSFVALRFSAPRLRSQTTAEYHIYALAPANPTGLIVADLLSVAVEAISAVLLAMVILRVQNWQEARRELV